MAARRGTKGVLALGWPADGRAARAVRPGSIGAATALVIGGRASCDQAAVQCDDVPGTIDAVQIDAG